MSEEINKVKWPVFESHEQVVCYVCNKIINGNNRIYGSSYFAAGSGEFNKKCQCGEITWYDIKKEEK
jgi:hypothetical protein